MARPGLVSLDETRALPCVGHRVQHLRSCAGFARLIHAPDDDLACTCARRGLDGNPRLVLSEELRALPCVRQATEYGALSFKADERATGAPPQSL